MAVAKVRIMTPAEMRRLLCRLAGTPEEPQPVTKEQIGRVREEFRRRGLLRGGPYDR